MYVNVFAQERVNTVWVFEKQVEETITLKFATSELAKSASRSFLYVKFKCTAKLYTSLVEPILYYCSGIWVLTDYSKINTVQNKACLYFLGVGKMLQI